MVFGSKVEDPASAHPCKNPLTASVVMVDSVGFVVDSYWTIWCINFHAESVPSKECCFDQNRISSALSFKETEFDSFPASRIRLVRFLHGWFWSSCNCPDVDDSSKRRVILETESIELRECLEHLENELIDSVMQCSVMLWIVVE